MNLIKPLRVTPRHLALGLAAAVGCFGTGPSANAAPPVTGYVHWFDASTLGLANDAGVTAWPDGGSSGGNATVPSGNATPTYVADAGTGTGLGAIYFARNGGAASSGALLFTRDSSIRTVFSVFKGCSFLLTDQEQYHFHRSEGGDTTNTDPATGLWGRDASGSITSGQTYVNGVRQNYPALIDSTNSMPTDLHNGFNLVEVLTTGPVRADSFNKDRGTIHAGNQYQAEVILYDRVLTEQERVQVETYLMSKWFAVPLTPDAKIFEFGPGAVVDPIVSNAAVIAWTLPYGTNVTALATAFTLASGATCKVNGSTVNSGDTFNFTQPVEFTVKSSDSLITNVYTVTVTLFGSGTPKGEMNVTGYDTTLGTSFLNPIANLLAVAPSGTGLQTADINYGTFAGVLPGITANDTFSVIWDGWLDVTKSGHGDYTFGTSSDDGSVVYVDLNNDGVFDPATELVVNNNNYQVTTVKTGTVTLNMNSVHVLIGYFESEGGQSMEARFAKGTAVSWSSMQNVIGAGPYFQASNPNPPTDTATATVVTTSGVASTVGDSVTLTATVTPAPPGGTVQFHDNGTDLGAAASVDAGTGVATLPTSDLTVASHTITATYGGTTGFLTSADSTGANQTVLSKYDGWALLKGLASGNNDPNDDPDADAVPNVIEFAINGNPKSAADNGMIHVTTENSTFYGGKVLVLTVAVRAGTPAEWPANAATIDGITYTIEGGTMLNDFSSDISIVGRFDNNTYAPDISAAGYEWRRFVLDSSNGLGGKGFLRARVTQP